MSRILITGGAGFIGSHLCERMLAEGHHVTIVDNFDDFYPKSWKLDNIQVARTNRHCVVYELDVRDGDAMRAVLTTGKFEVVVHLAARPGVRPSLDLAPLYWDINTRGTLTLLELAKELKPAKFIFASSSSIYGNSAEIPFVEERPGDEPVSPYAASKRAAELLCSTYQHLYGLNVTCLRLFTVYGPRNRPDLAVAKFTELIDRGEVLPLFGDGTAKRDFTYIDDIVSGFMGAIEHCEGFSTYNLGNSNPVELGRLIEVIEGALGKSARIAHEDWKPGDVDITYADVSKAKREIGYAPTRSIEEGVADYVAWYRDVHAVRRRA
jgi:UDP-glucuronate 4-epimerase